MIVADYCRRDVVIIDQNQTPLDAAIAMRECHSGDVVVVESQQSSLVPLGVVTDRDIAIEIVAEQIDPQEVTIKDIVIKPLVTIKENDDLSNCIKTMKQHAVRRLPVVDNAGHLVGIISVDDVIEALSSDINDFAVLFNTPPQQATEG